MFSRSSKPQNRIDSLIGTTTRIEGNVIFSGGLRVDGMIRGNVSAVADQREIRDIAQVEVALDRNRSLTLLFDPEHALDDRIAMEQFIV